MKKILLTGAAGFIGYHLAIKLLKEGNIVIGLDNLNDYYDPILKHSRLKNINNFIDRNKCSDNFKFYEMDISNDQELNKLFLNNNFDVVINLAAQAGVRYSIENPRSYVNSNVNGFFNIIECCKNYNIEHLIYASSSSVYGMNKEQPFYVKDNTDYPISLYAATKKSNELIAFSYSHLFKIPVTGLRFFTVYGPYGRPDMAYFKFAKAISEDKLIEVYNNGDMMRDFTYIDDIVEAIFKLIPITPHDSEHDSTNAMAPYKLYNIGNNKPVKLIDFINLIEKYIGKKALIKMLPMQPGDVPVTFANIDDLNSVINFRPKTKIEDGLKKFIDWFIVYNQNN